MKNGLKSGRAISLPIMLPQGSFQKCLADCAGAKQMQRAGGMAIKGGV